MKSTTHPSGQSIDHIHSYTLCKWNINQAILADDEYISYYHRSTIVHECKQRIAFTQEHGTWVSKWAIY
jgi:hypothetical protein